jgi:hypothetical protein
VILMAPLAWLRISVSGQTAKCGPIEDGLQSLSMGLTVLNASAYCTKIVSMQLSVSQTQERRHEEGDADWTRIHNPSNGKMIPM